MAGIRRQTMPSVGEEIGKLRAPPHPHPQTAGRKARWCSHFGKPVWQVLKKLRIELPQDPATPHPGIYPRERVTYSHTKHSRVDNSIIHNSPKVQRPQCPPADEWADKCSRVVQRNAIWQLDRNEDTDGPWERYSKGRKPDTKAHTLCKSMFRKCPE